MRKDPWNDHDVYDAHSPLNFVGNVKTPVLLQHGDADIRVPFSQGIMFYNALKRRNVPVRMLVLPRQPHWTYRTEDDPGGDAKQSSNGFKNILGQQSKTCRSFCNDDFRREENASYNYLHKISA
jgi:acetyl esterase/lipase